MRKKITAIIRRPDRIGLDLEAARRLAGDFGSLTVVFFCPGCASHTDCSAGDGGAERPLPRCFTDRFGKCLPRGFQPADAERIARMVRDSDIVVPL
jgi:hypothetical protein